MKKFIYLQILVVLVCGRIAAGQAEQWLQYHSAREAREIVGDMSSHDLDVKTDKPADVKMPEFKCEKPYYAQWSSPLAKNGSVWIALDRTNKYGAYDLLYIDSDGDGHLNDQTALKAYRTEQDRSWFGPAKVTLIVEDEPIGYHLNFVFYNSDRRRKVRAYSGGWYEGAVDVGGAKLHCVLIDRNANGTFDDKSIDFGQCDRIRVGKKLGRDTRYVGNYIKLSDKLYRLAVARDGAYVKLNPADDVKFGELSLPECVTNFSVVGENGSFVGKMEKGVAKLPVGKYRLDYWAIERKDDKGNNWKLKGRGFGDNGLIEITETGQAKLAVGEPIVANLTAKENNGRYSFNQELKGPLGERIELTRNSSRARAPKVHIKSKDSTYDRTFTFEYG